MHNLWHTTSLQILHLHIPFIALVGLVRGPQGEVVSEQLHDQGGVLVRLLRQRVQLRDRVIERLLGEVTGSVGRVEDLVVEHREIEGQAQADRVRGRQVAVGDRGGR